MIAATGIPKLETGPQKWVEQTYLNVSLLNNLSVKVLKVDIAILSTVFFCQVFGELRSEKTVRLVEKSWR